MMTVQNFVDDILQIPVTRVGNKQTAEAIELILDTNDNKFYGRLSEITGKSYVQLENSIRDAKEMSMKYMNPELRSKIFSNAKSPLVTNTEFILLSARYYKENYED